MNLIILLREWTVCDEIISMKEETLKLLQSADDPLLCMGPANSNGAEIMERVRLLKVDLEQYLGASFLLSDPGQNTSYVATLYAEDVICIRFSAWGNFFTIWDGSSYPASLQPQYPLLTDDDFQEVIRLIESYNFVHVSYADLGEPYDGPNEHFKKERWPRMNEGKTWPCFKEGEMQKTRASWWVRYFDYV